MLGAHVPGDSPLHRAPAGAKLAALAAGMLVLGLLRSPAAVAAGLGTVAALVVVAGVGARAVLAQLRPLAWVLAALVPVQVWFSGPRAAAVATGTLLAGVAAAAVVTLTTRTEDLLDALVRALGPLRRVGVVPERIALVLALAIRAVPVLAGLARDVQEARAARGAERSVRAFAVPLVIRSLRHADRLGEALAARGVDDEGWGSAQAGGSDLADAGDGRGGRHAR